MTTNGRTYSMTREDAMTAQYFHEAIFCARTVTIGPRGGITPPHTEVWRRNGATRTWKRDAERIEVPVKYGMYGYGTIRQLDGWHVGTPEACEHGTLAASLDAAYNR